MPLLLGVDTCSTALSPLSQFQSKKFDKKDVLALLSSLNQCLPSKKKLSDEQLHSAFDIRWPKLYGSLQGAVEQVNGETETGFPWLFSPKDLERREIDPTSKSVWVVTPWPYQDVQLACLVSMLRRNIGLGVRYTFIIPCDPTGQSREALHQMFDDKIVVHEVETETFDSLAVTHYVVLNPFYADACRPRVFLEIPTEEKGYWIETSADAAIKFTNRFSQLISSRQCPSATLATGDAVRLEVSPS